MDVERKKFSLLEKINVTLFFLIVVVVVVIAVISVVGVVDVVVYGGPTAPSITGL